MFAKLLLGMEVRIVAQPPEVSALLTAANEVTVPLRLGDGLDDIALESLRSALRRCAQAWANDQLIPKAGANVLVDLANAVEATANLYPEGYRQRVQDVAWELADLVRACVAVQPEQEP
jgi:hypothetical protein